MTCRYRFEDFEFVDDPPLLTRGGQPVAASSRVLALIGCLLEAGGRVVDKATLLDRVWGHRHLTDAALARLVMHARRALDDDGQAQRIIRTAHGQGFLIAVPVERLLDDSNSSARAPIGSSQPLTRTGPMLRGRLAAAALVVLALGGAVIATLLGAGGSSTLDRGRSGPVSSPAAETAIVVQARAPSGAEELEALAEVLPELLADRLAVHEVRVLTADEQRGSGLRGAYGVDEALEVALDASPSGVRARLRSLDDEVRDRSDWPTLEAPSVAALVQQLAYSLAARLAGQGDRVVDRADPVIDELELRARIAWSRGRSDEALKAIDAALALDEAALGLQLLRFEIALADQASPARLLDEFLSRIEAAEDRLSPAQRARLLQRAGRHAWFAGDAEAAERLLSPALDLARQARAPLTEALVRNSLSQAQQSLGRFEEAWENAQMAIELLRDGNYAYHLALALTNLGYMAEDRGQLSLAGRLHGEALEIRTRYGFDRLIAASQYGLARVERRSGALASAADRVSEAAVSMAERGQAFDRISALEELAVIERLRGRFESAEQALDQAESLARDLDDGLGLAWLMDVRGRLRLAQGRANEAVDLLRRSVAGQVEHGEIHEVRYTRMALLDALRTRVATAIDAADPTDVDASVRRAEVTALERALIEASGEFTQNQRSALAVVQLRDAARTGDPAAALEACRSALSIARNAGALDHEAAAALECARAHRRAGDAAAAERMDALAEAWSSEWYAWAAASRADAIVQAP